MRSEKVLQVYTKLKVCESFGSSLWDYISATKNVFSITLENELWFQLLEIILIFSKPTHFCRADADEVRTNEKISKFPRTFGKISKFHRYTFWKELSFADFFKPFTFTPFRYFLQNKCTMNQYERFVFTNVSFSRTFRFHERFSGFRNFVRKCIFSVLN